MIPGRYMSRSGAWRRLRRNAGHSGRRLLKWPSAVTPKSRMRGSEGATTDCSTMRSAIFMSPGSRRSFFTSRPKKREKLLSALGGYWLTHAASSSTVLPTQRRSMRFFSLALSRSSVHWRMSWALVGSVVLHAASTSDAAVFSISGGNCSCTCSVSSADGSLPPKACAAEMRLRACATTLGMTGARPELATALRAVRSATLTVPPLDTRSSHTSTVAIASGTRETGMSRGECAEALAPRASER
mmetsp:Transcript_48773/g.150628  ORF Transcript_48773/g.150628 Transcript_48773/m.150628 type:complete len:243 (-) Transcript_48773:1561-2289(-)